MAEHQRGTLKIYMGYAAGVGKTYQMLEHAHELKAKGIDVVVGYVETHGRKDTLAKTEGLEIIPRKKIEYRGALFEEMDTGAILQRRPHTCAVDEFPHTNVPGSKGEKRWEDIEVLLDAGIHIMTTMNIQHLESLNDQVWQFTGIRVRETIPDWVVQQADEVVMIDLTPRALLHRLKRGVVYGTEKADRAMQNFFRESTLVALRELALRQTAHEVEHRMVDEEAKVSNEEALLRKIGKDQRILVFTTPDPETAMLIRRAKRVSDFLGAECFAVAVQSVGRALGEGDREIIHRHLNFARNLHIETRILEGQDIALTLVDFARRNQITQIFLSQPRNRQWFSFSHRNLVQKIVSLAKDMQIVIVAELGTPGGHS